MPQSTPVRVEEPAYLYRVTATRTTAQAATWSYASTWCEALASALTVLHAWQQEGYDSVALTPWMRGR